MTNDNDPSNNSFVITLQTTVMDNPTNIGISGSQTDLDNSASIQIGSDTPITSNDVTVTVVEPQMTILKEFSPTAASPNDLITITLTVTNTGLSNAFEVIVTDPISNTIFHTINEDSTPADYTYSTAIVAGETVVTYTGDPGSFIAPGASETFSFTAIVQPDLTPSPPDIDNVATVTQATTLDSTSVDGDDTEERDEPDVNDDDQFTVIIPDPSIDKDDGIIYVSDDELVIYDLTITNNGAQIATGVIVTETVPLNTTFDLTNSSPTWTGCADGAAAGTVCTFNIGTLGVGADTTIQFAMRVDSPLPANTATITNTATTADDGTQGFDPNPGDNSDSDVDEVRAAIGDYVWHDQNGNGIPDAGEQPLSGVTVELYNTSDVLISSTTTLADGSYQIIRIDPGDYYLVFTAPTGFVASPIDQGGDDDNDSDINAAGQTITTTLSPGEYDSSWDAGFFDIDLGDAPDSYGTLLSNSGANHLLNEAIYLGATIDGEIDGQPAATALSDDSNGDDEDGVLFDQYIGTPALPSAIMTIGNSSEVTVTAVITPATTGYLNAWLDFNADGDFNDLGEQIATDSATTGGTINLTVNVPADAVQGSTYARFRFSTATGLTPTNRAPDGEVEDYLVQLFNPPEKTLAATSEAHTTGSNLAIGEIARYRITVPVPEGVSTNFTITDSFPAGLLYIAGSDAVTYDADISLSASAYTVNGGPFSDGTDPIFSFGTVTNDDRDAGVETIIVEFDALLLNDRCQPGGDHTRQ